MKLEQQYADEVAQLKAQIEGLEEQLASGSVSTGEPRQRRLVGDPNDERVKQLQKELEEALAESNSRKVIIEGLMVRLKELEDLLRKLGHGKEVDAIMGNAFRNLLAHSGFASVFERLYQDALNRIKRIAELRSKIQKMENSDWQMKMTHIP